jgi:serine/threonine-protein kinase
MAYEILTGERPFAGEHLGTVVYKIVAEEPAVVHRLNPSLSPEIDAVIRKGLSKKADDRYPNCTAFINALEGACLQAEGWQSLARGTSHTIPTNAEPVLAKTRAPKTERTGRRKAPPTRGSTQQQRKTSVFFPALGAFVVVLGVLGLLGWQSGLWQPMPEPAKVAPPIAQAEETKPEPEPPKNDVETPPPAPIVEPEKPPSAPTVVRKPAAKPTPETKAPVRVAAAEVTPRLGAAQVVFVQSNPSGVTALLDNRADTACETPCILLASPGAHILSLTLANYQKEIRPIKVTDSRLDVPLITMHPNGGTLMISTVPQGANIFVDDRLMGSLTPAQISLPGGSYNIKVVLNEAKKTQRIDISNGNTKYLKIFLNP